MKRILIMAGGTGGHVFPALAVALELQKRGLHVEWLGTKKGIESQCVPQEGLTIHYLNIAGVRGTGLKNLALAPFHVIRAIKQARTLLRQIKPDLVVGFGGFVSGPGGFAAWLLRIPLVIHEQNAIPGTTNKILARFARYVLESFPESFHTMRHLRWTGNPVRAQITRLPIPVFRFESRSKALRLLILGGSAGAQAINTVIPHAVALLPQQDLEIWHQAGPKHEAATRAAYESLNFPAIVAGFITDIAAAYEWADVVLCRAGATTIAELIAVGLGSILVPYPYAADDHQRYNAEYLVNVGAATLVMQENLTAEYLYKVLDELIKAGRPPLLEQAVNAKGLYRGSAVDQVVEICLGLL